MEDCIDMFHKRLDGFDFYVSTRKGKKYDVYKNDKYITSFGGKGMAQYKDKIGYYSKYDHLDKKRRDAYRSRHKNDHINDKTTAGFFSWFYLW